MKISVGAGQSHYILGTTFNAGHISDSKPAHILCIVQRDSGYETNLTFADICRGALQASEGPASAAAPFFLTFFVVFNQAAPSISFASQY